MEEQGYGEAVSGGCEGNLGLMITVLGLDRSRQELFRPRPSARRMSWLSNPFDDEMKRL